MQKMPRLSRLIPCVIIGLALCSGISSQQNVLPNAKNTENAAVVEHRKEKGEAKLSQQNRAETIHEADNSAHNRAYPVGETHLVGTPAPAASEEVHPANDVHPDGDARNHEAVSAVKSPQNLTDAKAPEADTVPADEGVIQKIVNWILDIIQTDFNFLISCGTVMSALLTQIIPLHTIMTIRWNKSTGDLKTLNFVTVAFANFLWSLYGMISENTVIILSSLPGFLLSCCYICVFHRHCLDSHQMNILRMFYKLAVVSCLILMLIYLGVDRESYLKFIGLFGGSIQGFSYIAPLLSIKEIIKNRSTSAMPMEISLANFIGAFFTLCYGFIIWDYIVIAPNFVGMASGMIQIILLVLIPNNDKIIVKEVDILEKQHFKPVLKSDLEM